MYRSVPNSPTNRYRRKSFAISKKQNPGNSMKDMMSELATRLSRGVPNPPRRRSLSVDGGALLAISQDLGGGMPDTDPMANPTGIQLASAGERGPEDATESHEVRTLSPASDSELTARGKATKHTPRADQDEEYVEMQEHLAQRSAGATSSVNNGVGSPEVNRLPRSSAAMDVSLTLLSPQASPNPLLCPAQQIDKTLDQSECPRADQNPRTRATPISMKDMMAELATKAKAREERLDATMISPRLPSSLDISRPRGQEQANLLTGDLVGKRSILRGENAVAVRTNDIIPELAAKTRATERGSNLTTQSPRPLPPPVVSRTTGQEEAKLVEHADKSNAAGMESETMVGMKGIVAELAITAKAREDRADKTTLLPRSSSPATVPKPTTRDKEDTLVDIADKTNCAREINAAGTMKYMLTELATKAKAKGERPALRDDASPPCLTQPIWQGEEAHLNDGSNKLRLAGGAGAAGGIKGMMAELASKAKAREERLAAASTTSGKKA